jgi:hypothetical protein
VGADGGGKRGFLRPENRLQWKGSAAAGPAPKPAKPVPGASAARGPAAPARPKGLPSNAIPQSQYTLDQLKKMAASRGLSVEKLVAQMVQQYLKESPGEP